jgi:hypothetical protein
VLAMVVGLFGTVNFDLLKLLMKVKYYLMVEAV